MFGSRRRLRWRSPLGVLVGAGAVLGGLGALWAFYLAWWILGVWMTGGGRL
ncbi:hypothetical protein TPY_3132 [Sulfobacillus acidophilus TPY]|nr:hypothetical protein TPY_3132 [Sulfobacillus acidophilus TPY]